MGRPPRSRSHQPAVPLEPLGSSVWRHRMMAFDLREELDEFMAAREAELIAFRRDLHAHPETGYREYRTTSRVLERLASAGLRPLTLPKGTGLVADVGGPVVGGSAPGGPMVALRA